MVKFYCVEFTPPPAPETQHGLAKLNMGKKIKNASNGLKMILADFQHVELPPPW